MAKPRHNYYNIFDIINLGYQKWILVPLKFLKHLYQTFTLKMSNKKLTKFLSWASNMAVQCWKWMILRKIYPRSNGQTVNCQCLMWHSWPRQILQWRKRKVIHSMLLNGIIDQGTSIWTPSLTGHIGSTMRIDSWMEFWESKNQNLLTCFNNINLMELWVPTFPTNVL